MTKEKSALETKPQRALSAFVHPFYPVTQAHPACPLQSLSDPMD